ncbi:MAG: homocysteine S-methyltransferase family protein, partial [Gammaproteobacteria bacterium]
GAEVLTTNTYSILDAPSWSGRRDIHQEPAHWMDMARIAIELPRRAAAESGKPAAVAFSIGGDIESAAQRDTIELLLRVFARAAPDLILFETLSMIEDNLTLACIEMLRSRGWPVWVSFRRCRHGVCGIHGQLWGGPEGDRFGRLARQLESAGAEALLINCLPMARVGGTLAWLADFTDLPLGVYPNVGRYVESGWKFDPALQPQQFAEQALAWRAEGARIIGGCCGVGPAEIAAAHKQLTGVARGRPAAAARPAEDSPAAKTPGKNARRGNDWRDARERPLYPLRLPRMMVEPGVFMPTQGSYLVWKFLFANTIGAKKRCLDIGCGVGILSIQLALNGAESVTAVDIQQAAIDNTMANAFRNGVSARITGRAEDLYSFTSAQKFDVVVASLPQMPVDPRGQYSGHREIDYWGRNMLDHLLGELPCLIEEDGAAYVMQVSTLGAERTETLLRENGCRARVVDFNLYQFNPVFTENLAQIRRVEELSDAYHFDFGEDERVMVMYLLEITRAPRV